MRLCRLIYKSSTSWELLTNEVLAELANSSEEKNKKRDISGLLALSGESFLQVLEGPEDKVNALYAKIIRDKRHFKVTLTSYEQIAKRNFGEWSMKVVDLSDLPVSTRDIFRKKYQTNGGYPVIPDDSNLLFAMLLDIQAFCKSEEG